MKFSKYFQVIDNNDVVRFESVYKEECEQYLKDIFVSTGDLFNIEEVTID